MGLLKKLLKNELIPFHMPGHKRNTEIAEYLKILRADLDITEIYSFDNLNDAEGILLEYMKKASEIWKSDRSFFSVGGSTSGILAGIKTLTNYGDNILISRNCHKSVYHAAEILGLNVSFIEEEIYKSNADYSRVEINSAQNVSLIVITSPSYEGVVQNIKEISAIAHKKNIPLMVDEAHGSHLGLSDGFHKSAIEMGADLVVQSLHKTGLSLTQTGIIHIKNERVNAEEFKRNLGMFQSSSPSYILIASICEYIDFIEKNQFVFDEWVKILNNFYENCKNLVNIGIIKSEYKDLSKINIDLSNCNIDGATLMKILREKYKIELEMAYADFALAMTGVGETKESLDSLFLALKEIDLTLSQKKKEVFCIKNTSGFTNISAVKKSKGRLVDKNEAVGKISLSCIYMYPPAVPIISIGEIISKEQLNILGKIPQNAIKDDTNSYPLFLVI